MIGPQTLFDKLWEEHRILTNAEGLDLIHVDRSLLTDLSGTIGLEDLDEQGRVVRNPELQVAVPDHVIATGPEDTPRQAALRARFVDGLDRLTAKHGLRHFGRGSGRQGIVHIMALEQGFALPGLTVVCGDSHTSTHGAVGALAWGIGSTEVTHVLATQTLWMQRPKRARIFLIIARTDSRQMFDLGEAIRRCQLYKEAGADILFVDAPQSLEEVERIGRELPGSLMINMVPQKGFVTPNASAENLRRMGYAIAFYPGLLLSPALAAMERSLEHFLENGLVDPDAVPAVSPHELVGFPAVWADEARWQKRFGK